MEKHVILGTLVTATLLMTACGNSEATTKSGSKGGSNALVVSAFGLNEDIVKEGIITPFERENETKITLEVGNSADRFTELKGSPNAGIDVTELTQANAAQGGEDGLLEKVIEKEVPNLSQLTPGVREVFESDAGVPIAVNSIGTVYNKEKLGKEIKSWDDLWSADLKDKVSVPGVATMTSPLMLYVASEHTGRDITKDNGKTTFEAMEELKPNVVKTYSKSSDLANMLQSGEIETAVVTDLAADIVQGAAENMTCIVPESGTYANYNTVDIPKKARNKETAFRSVNTRINRESQKAKAISLNEGPISQ